MKMTILPLMKRPRKIKLTMVAGMKPPTISPRSPGKESNPLK